MITLADICLGVWFILGIAELLLSKVDDGHSLAA